MKIQIDRTKLPNNSRKYVSEFDRSNHDLSNNKYMQEEVLPVQSIFNEPKLGDRQKDITVSSVFGDNSFED